MTNPSLKEEFEKAFRREIGESLTGSHYAYCELKALWAAKWMAERCALNAESFIKEEYHQKGKSDSWAYGCNTAVKDVAYSIRKLSKELQ